MANKRETRSVATEVRAEQQGGQFILVGRALSYNKLSKDLGGFREQIAPGCFRASLAAPDFDCKALANHDASLILGRTKSGTLQLEDRADGLYFRVQLDPANPIAQSIYSAVSRGDMDECSFAFMDADDEYDVASENGVKFPRRTVRSAKLLDVSVVTYPAYGNGATAASARAVRSFDYGTSEVRGGYSAQEIADLQQRLADMQTDWMNQQRAHEIGMQLRQELRLADNADGSPRSIEDFLSSRIRAKFGPSRLGHASRYVLKEAEVSAQGKDGSMAGVAKCYDFDAVPMRVAKIRFMADANGQCDFAQPEYLTPEEED